MKRITTLLLVLLLFGVGAWAQNKVSLSSTEGHPGDVVRVQVDLACTDDITAAEIIVPLHKQLTYVEGSARLNAERADGHTLSAAVVNGELRLYVYSVTLSTLRGTEGALATFDLKLKKEPATYPLTPRVVLSQATGVAQQVSTETGSVTLLSPKLTVNTPSIDYGHIPIRSTYTQSLLLHNSGNEPLTIAGMDFSAAEFSATETQMVIAAGQTRAVTLTYAPTVRGAVSETVRIHSDAINGTQQATLVADPFSVNELHTGTAAGNSDEEVEIAIKVNNMEPLVGMQCTYVLPEQLKYVDGSFAPTERAQSHTAVATLNNGALTLILYSAANATFTDEDGVLATFRVKPDGKSGTYTLAPSAVVLSNATVENMTSATTGGWVQVKSPKLNCSSTIDMGRVSVTETPQQTFTIRNYGQAPLQVSRATFLTEGFEMLTPLPITLDPSATATLTISYRPEAEGTIATTMNLYTNDPECRMQAVKLEGTVYEPNVLTAEGNNIPGGGYTLTVGMDNYTDIVGLQMDIEWLPGMKTLSAALTPTARLAGHAHTVADMGNGVYRVIIYSMSNADIAAGEGALFTLDYTPDADTHYRDTEIRITNIVLSTSAGVNYASSDETGCVAAFTRFEKGDTNGDGEVDVADVTNLVYHILRKPTAVFIEEAADMQDDGELDVADAMAIVDIILNKNK